MNVLISVYNVSGYLEAELKALLKKPEVQIVLWQVPCDLNPHMAEALGERCRWLDRTQVATVAELRNCLQDWIPDVYICGGWNDRVFVSAARYYHVQGCKTVVCMDTPWEGRLRQYLNCVRSRFVLLPTFDFVFCAGEPQAHYARKLGFRDKRIVRGLYCADTEKFAALYRPEEKRSHTFLYVGRYISVKNMRRMEAAFLRALELVPESDWTLTCIGGGALWDERTQHPRIQHLGYKAPHELQNYISEAGCFVLPSLREPWGVVVHEFALMGLPLLCSNKVNAATAYLNAGENGYTFAPLAIESTTEAFVKIMRATDEERNAMGMRSHALGIAYTTDDWATRVVEFVKGKEK